MGSQPGGSTHSPFVDWVAVYVMLAGCVGLGLAMPLKSWWVAGAGAVAFAVGGVIALVYGLMDHTEDYEMSPRPSTGDESADRPSSPQTRRIISA